MIALLALVVILLCSISLVLMIEPSLEWTPRYCRAVFFLSSLILAMGFLIGDLG